MKQKLKYLFMFMAVVILTTANNAYALIARRDPIGYRTINETNPPYLIFNNYFLILSFIILITTITIYFFRNKTNEKRIRNINIIIIIWIILSISVYNIGLNNIPEFTTRTEKYLNVTISNPGEQISGSSLINLIDDITSKQIGIGVIVKTEDYVDDYTGMTYEEKLEESPDIVSTGSAINPYATYVVTAVNKKPNGEVASIEFSFTR